MGLQLEEAREGAAGYKAAQEVRVGATVGRRSVRGECLQRIEDNTRQEKGRQDNTIGHNRTQDK